MLSSAGSANSSIASLNLRSHLSLEKSASGAILGVQEDDRSEWHPHSRHGSSLVSSPDSTPPTGPMEFASASDRIGTQPCEETYNSSPSHGSRAETLSADIWGRTSHRMGKQRDMARCTFCSHRPTRPATPPPADPDAPLAPTKGSSAADTLSRATGPSAVLRHLRGLISFRRSPMRPITRL